LPAPERQHRRPGTVRWVTGIQIAHCGHFIPDEQPQALAEALAAFFA